MLEAFWNHFKRQVVKAGVGFSSAFSGSSAYKNNGLSQYPLECLAIDLGAGTRLHHPKVIEAPHAYRAPEIVPLIEVLIFEINTEL